MKEVSFPMRAYNHRMTQRVLDGFIVTYFFFKIIESQVRSTDDSYVYTENTFTLIFVLDLVVNIIANWFWDFVGDMW